MTRGCIVEGNTFKADEMGEICSTHGREKEGHGLEYIGVDGKSIVKFVS
jgi:hypothetical protein